MTTDPTARIDELLKHACLCLLTASNLSVHGQHGEGMERAQEISRLYASIESYLTNHGHPEGFNYVSDDPRLDGEDLHFISFDEALSILAYHKKVSESMMEQVMERAGLKHMLLTETE